MFCAACADATARERFFASSCTVFSSQLSLNLLFLLYFFSFAQVGVLVMLRCLLSRAMLLLPLSSLCITTCRVVAYSSSRCCLLTLRDFARSCSLAAFSAPGGDHGEHMLCASSQLTVVVKEAALQVRARVTHPGRVAHLDVTPWLCSHPRHQHEGTVVGGDWYCTTVLAHDYRLYSL